MAACRLIRIADKQYAHPRVSRRQTFRKPGARFCFHNGEVNLSGIFGACMKSFRHVGSFQDSEAFVPEKFAEYSTKRVLVFHKEDRIHRKCPRTLTHSTCQFCRPEPVDRVAARRNGGSNAWMNRKSEL